MSYTRNEKGEIVPKTIMEHMSDAFKKKKETLPPPIPEPEKPKPTEYWEAMLNNQQAMYNLLLEIQKDVAIIRDESVDEASRKFKDLQAELVEQIAELDKKKKKK